MIAGLHWTAWLLLVVAVGLGLVIEVRFFARQWRSSGSAADSGSILPEADDR